MADGPTVGELSKAHALADDDITAAVEAFMADPKAAAFDIAGSYSVNLASAVKAHPFARDNLRNPEASPGLKRAAVRKAIMLARPEKR